MRSFKNIIGTSRDDDVGLNELEAIQAYLESRRRGVIPHPRLIEAWEHFYHRNTSRIRAFIASYPLSEADRDDCLQEVWKEVIVELRDFRHDPRRGRLRTWLLVLARNKAVDVLRRRIRHPDTPLDGEVEAALPDRAPGPAAEHERRRVRGPVRGVLAELSGQVSACSYQILHLRWIEGRQFPEIAAALDLTPAQVRFRHHRVIQKFRRLFVERSNGTASPGAE